MSIISAFLQQTIYMGMPDDSVRKAMGLIQLLRPTTLFFSFFLSSCGMFEWKNLLGGVWSEAKRDRQRIVRERNGWVGSLKVEGRKEKGVE